MATQYTSRAKLPYWQLGDRDWHLPYQVLCQRLDGFNAVGALALVPTLVDASGVPAGLGLSFSGGTFPNASGAAVTVAASTATAPASVTTYYWVTPAGVLTAGAAWPTTNHFKVAVVVAGATDITSVTDARWSGQMTVVDLLAFYGATPVARPSGSAQAALTDSTGGTAGTTLSNVGTSFNQATLNNNFATLANLVNALRSALAPGQLNLIKGSA